MIPAIRRRRRRLGGGGGAPVLLASDAFNRANNTSSMGTADTGQVWQADVASWGITNNTAYRSSGTTVSHAYLDVGQADMRALVKVTALPTSGSAGFIVRFTPGAQANFINAVIRTAGLTYNFEQWVNGVFTSLGSSTAVCAVGDIVEIVVSGNSVQLWVNDNLEIDTTTTLLSGQNVALRTPNSSSAIRYDDLFVYDKR